MCIVERLKSEISLRIETVSDLREIDNGSYIILTSVDRIPPHLGIVHGKKYYSLSVKGSSVGEDFDRVATILSTKKIPCILIEVKGGLNHEALDVEFSKIPRLEQGQSCLIPIRGYFENTLKRSLNAKYIFELIPVLDELNLIGLSYGFGLKENEEFILKEYTDREIQECIDRISNQNG